MKERILIIEDDEGIVKLHWLWHATITPTWSSSIGCCPDWTVWKFASGCALAVVCRF